MRSITAKPASGSESDDTVRIMSIHKSKGLEFPVVFVSGLGKQFNETELRGRLALHSSFGIGCDYVDTTLRLRQPSLLKKDDSEDIGSGKSR